MLYIGYDGVIQVFSLPISYLFPPYIYDIPYLSLSTCLGCALFPAFQRKLIFINMIRLKPILTEISREEAAQYARTTNDRSPVNYPILRYAARIASMLGETVSGAPLGEGAYGHAFPLASGKVMKITMDPDEVASAAHFRTRRKTPHIMSYYDARAIAPRNGYNQFFVLTMDRITPLKHWQQSLWDQHLYFDRDNTDAYVLDMIVRRRAGMQLPPTQATEFINRIVAQRAEVLRAVQSFGVKTYEAHANNVGFDAMGRLTVFDMWSTRSNTTAAAITSIRKMLKTIDLTPYLGQAQPDASGIDTPGDPNM